MVAAGLVHGSLTLCEKHGVPVGDFFQSVGLNRSFGCHRVKKATARDDAEHEPQSHSNGRNESGSWMGERVMWWTKGGTIVAKSTCPSRISELSKRP